VNDQLLTIVTLALIGLTAVMSLVAIRRLRTEMRHNARSLLLGAGVPLLATIAYVALGQPPSHPLILAGLGVVGGVLGMPLAVFDRVEARGGEIFVRQAGVTMLVWAAAYVIAALTALEPSAQAQAITAVALAAAAGMAAGSQVGLSMRVSRRRSAVRSETAGGAAR
jgi:hypothetical protein